MQSVADFRCSTVIQVAHITLSQQSNLRSCPVAFSVRSVYCGRIVDSSDAQVQHASSIMERYNSLSAMSVVGMVPKAEGKSGRKLEILQLTVRLVHLVGYSDVLRDNAIDLYLEHHVAIRTCTAA